MPLHHTVSWCDHLRLQTSGDGAGAGAGWVRSSYVTPSQPVHTLERTYKTEKVFNTASRVSLAVRRLDQAIFEVLDVRFVKRLTNTRSHHAAQK